MAGGADEPDIAAVTSECATQVPIVRETRPEKISVSAKFLDQQGDPVTIGEPDVNWHSDSWDAVLCDSILVTRKELLQLVACQLKTSQDRTEMVKISQCDWFIGRHVTVTTDTGTRLQYWGGGTYERVSRGVASSWQTWVEVEGCDTHGGRPVSRLAYVVCGLQLKNVKAVMGAPIPDELHEVQDREDPTEDEREKDTVTFLLVRYAQPHALSRKRGPNHRPLCPGPLQNTHCLWTWANRPAGHQRGCFRPRPWSRHRRYFGVNPREQEEVRDTDLRAWYDLIQITNVRCYANVQSDPDAVNKGMFLQSMVWC